MYPKLERIIGESLEIWKGYPEHPFIKELADGTLPEEKFLHYLIQDTLYLREYARAFAMAMYRSTTIEEIRAFYSILAFVNDGEGSFRLDWLKREGLSTLAVDKMPMAEENRAYCNFMLEVAEQQGVEEILMAVLPCMFSYAWIFEQVAENTPDVRESKYWPFIESYISKSYADDCRAWAAFTEARLQNCTEDELHRLSDIFQKSSAYETGFWDMSYRGR